MNPSTVADILITVTNDELISCVPTILSPKAPSDLHQVAFTSPTSEAPSTGIQNRDMSPQGIHHHKSELRDGDSLSGMLENLHLTRTPTRSNIGAGRLFDPSDKNPITPLQAHAVNFEIDQGIKARQPKKVPRKTQRIGALEPRRRVLVPIDGSPRVLATTAAAITTTAPASTSAASLNGNAAVQKGTLSVSTSSAVTLLATSLDDDIPLPGTPKKRLRDKPEPNSAAACDTEHKYKVEMLYG